MLVESDRFYKVTPFLKWAGGKRWLVESSGNFFPKSYNSYFEPFLGSGAVLFHLNPESAVISDANDDLVNAYKVICTRPKVLEERLGEMHVQHCSEFYYEIRNSRPKGKIERAARFIYLNRTCWNGLYRVNKKGDFNVPIGTKSKVVLDTDNFSELSRILSRYEITCCDFEETIDRSRKGDFLFIDPPYTVKHNNNGFVKYNETIFSWDDQLRLKKAIDRASSRGVLFCVSNAAHESLKDLYQDYHCQELFRSSVISGASKGRGVYGEIIVRNWN